MRLYGAIQKVEPQDDGTVRVYGIATSEAVDNQGEIVWADAMRAAIPEYMRFPALREMHQLSAAGTTLEAEVGEDGTTRIVAHVVDPVAVAKVKNQVYRGFSIGGRVTRRDVGNPRNITGLVLNEISLVDRPANPEAVFDCWKAATVAEASLADSAVSDTPQERFNSPIQIWACGVSGHRHLAKAEALKCLEKRIAEPIDLEIAAAEAPAAEANDQSATPPAQKRQLAEVAGTISDQCDDGAGAAFLQKGTHDMQKFAASPLAKAKHSQTDQSLLDMAQLACNKCLKMSGLSADERENLGKARGYLDKAGALPSEGSASEMMKALDVIAAVLGKTGGALRPTVNFAHGCLSELTGGAVCGDAAKVGARHSEETMEHFEAAHSHLVAGGANCDAGSTVPTEEEPMEFDAATGKAARSEDLAKALSGERAEKAALFNALDKIVPMLERLTKRVDDIARTPLPPLTIAKGTVSVSKQQDRGSADAGEPELSPEAVASALAKMSKDEQTLTLIKASYANPIRVRGSAAGKP
jgi:hypothetical protein